MYAGRYGTVALSMWHFDLFAVVDNKNVISDTPINNCLGSTTIFFNNKNICLISNLKYANRYRNWFLQFSFIYWFWLSQDEPVKFSQLNAELMTWSSDRMPKLCHSENNEICIFTLRSMHTSFLFVLFWSFYISRINSKSNSRSQL